MPDFHTKLILEKIMRHERDHAAEQQTCVVVFSRPEIGFHKNTVAANEWASHKVKVGIPVSETPKWASTNPRPTREVTILVQHSN